MPEFIGFIGLHPGSLDEVAQRFVETRQRVEGDVFPEDLETCGAFLAYTVPMEGMIANSIQAGMFDIGGILRTVESRYEWVDGLQAEAVGAREGAAVTPEL